MILADVLPGLPTIFGLGILEVMGIIALGILWVNMTLLAVVAFKRVAPCRQAVRNMGPSVGLGRGHTHLRSGGRVLLHGHIRHGEVAYHRVEQTGRSAGEGQIFFHDRNYSGELVGGKLEVITEAGPIQVELPAASEHTEVWPDAVAADVRAAEVDFEAAQAQARRASGYRRQLRTPIHGQVWVSAIVAPAEDGEVQLTVLAPKRASDQIVVSAVNPKLWAKRSTAICIGFGSATLAVTTGCTILALWPPVFGAVSTVGALAGMAALLSNMLFGNLVRDAVRKPSERLVGGVWTQK